MLEVIGGVIAVLALAAGGLGFLWRSVSRERDMWRDSARKTERALDAAEQSREQAEQAIERRNVAVRSIEATHDEMRKRLEADGDIAPADLVGLLNPKKD